MIIRGIEFIVTIMIGMKNRSNNSNKNDHKNRDYRTNSRYNNNTVTAGTQTFNGAVPNEDSHMAQHAANGCPPAKCDETISFSFIFLVLLELALLPLYVFL